MEHGTSTDGDWTVSEPPTSSATPPKSSTTRSKSATSCSAPAGSPITKTDDPPAMSDITITPGETLAVEAAIELPVGTTSWISGSVHARPDSVVVCEIPAGQSRSKPAPRDHRQPRESRPRPTPPTPTSGRSSPPAQMTASTRSPRPVDTQAAPSEEVQHQTRQSCHIRIAWLAHRSNRLASTPNPRSGPEHFDGPSLCAKGGPEQCSRIADAGPSSPRSGIGNGDRVHGRDRPRMI